jgi:hypothetical protein
MLPRPPVERLMVCGVLVWTCSIVSPVQAGSRMEPPKLPLLINGSRPDALISALRGYLVRSLPNPLYEDNSHWGNQKKMPRGVKWSGKMLPLRPEIVKGGKNQGSWRKVRITADRLADTLVLDIRDWRAAEQGKMTFTVFCAFDARAEYWRQLWEAGIKAFDASARARFRVKLTLHCEAVMQLEPGSFLVPDIVFRLHVLDSNLQWDNFVLEHVAGVGGEAAKLFGDGVKKALDKWHPSLERNLLAKANAAIVKAGSSKEVRIGLSQLLKVAGPRQQG